MAATLKEVEEGIKCECGWGVLLLFYRELGSLVVFRRRFVTAQCQTQIIALLLLKVERGVVTTINPKETGGKQFVYHAIPRLNIGVSLLETCSSMASTTSSTFLNAPDWSERCGDEG